MVIDGEGCFSEKALCGGLLDEYLGTRQSS